MTPNKQLKHDPELLKFKAILKTGSAQFFENQKKSVFMFDLDGRFIFFNEAAEKFLGYSPEQLIGSHFRILLTLDDLSDGFLFLYQTLNGCYTEHSLFRMRLKDGSTRVVGITAGPIYYQNKVRAALAIAHDLSGRNSRNPHDFERVKIFKKFSADLTRWAESGQ